MDLEKEKKASLEARLLSEWQRIWNLEAEIAYLRRKSIGASNKVQVENYEKAILARQKELETTKDFVKFLTDYIKQCTEAKNQEKD